MIWTFQTSTFFQMHAMGGTRGGTGGQDPLKNHENIGFPSNIDPDPLKITKLLIQASVKWWAIDTPAKRHFKGVSLMGRWWSVFSGISVLSHYPLWQKCSGSAHAYSACEPARLKLNCRQTKFRDILVLTTCDKDSDEPAQGCILNSALMATVCQACKLGSLLIFLNT